MRRKPPALRKIGIDLDARAPRIFRCDYSVELVHRCAHEFLNSFPFRGRELVCADPPYLHELRRGQRGYRYEYDRADQVALLGLLRGLRCQVMRSGYPSYLYDAYFPGWESMAATTTIASPPPSALFRRSPGT